MVEEELIDDKMLNKVVGYPDWGDESSIDTGWDTDIIDQSTIDEGECKYHQYEPYTYKVQKNQIKWCL